MWLCLGCSPLWSGPCLLRVWQRDSFLGSCFSSRHKDQGNVSGGAAAQDTPAGASLVTSFPLKPVGPSVCQEGGLMMDYLEQHCVVMETFSGSSQ